MFYEALEGVVATCDGHWHSELHESDKGCAEGSVILTVFVHWHLIKSGIHVYR